LQPNYSLNLLLAFWTEECASLSLYNSDDFDIRASVARLIFSVVDLMKVLVATFTIDRIAIGSIAQCRSFFLNRFLKNSNRFGMNPFPF
jgi:hypothetical protein